MTSSLPFVATVDLKVADKLLEYFKQSKFEITYPPHTCFLAKNQGITCTLYASGKLVVQGKKSAEFIEFYLEPEILKTFSFRHPLAQLNLAPHIGIDESGKGDFFGPLCIAGVYVASDQFAILHSLGVKDSKALTDRSIGTIARAIQKHVPYHIVKINPLKYNQIYADFKNLNRLLAWGHATTIEHLVERTGCQNVMIDQFADEWVVEEALKRKKLAVKLTQRHRAEEDLAVAAASILARYAFIEGLKDLGEEVGMTLPKGSSHTTLIVGQEILRRWGEAKLQEVCKQHFKIYQSLLEKNS